MKPSRTEATQNAAMAGAAQPRRGSTRRRPPPSPKQRTTAMAETIAGLRIQRGIDQPVTERDLRRAGFTDAEIAALGDAAIARAHEIVADAGHGRAA